jgi:hypothetical protein
MISLASLPANRPASTPSPMGRPEPIPFSNRSASHPWTTRSGSPPYRKPTLSSNPQLPQISPSVLSVSSGSLPNPHLYHPPRLYLSSLSALPPPHSTYQTPHRNLPILLSTIIFHHFYRSRPQEPPYHPSQFPDKSDDQRETLFFQAATAGKRR